jgi:3-oxoacyl-[acyl-carrier protein] reductase
VGQASQLGRPVDDVVKVEAAKDIPLGRVGEPSDMGSLMAFLCSDAAAFITGQLIAVDGGLVRGIY